LEKVLNPILQYGVGLLEVKLNYLSNTLIIR